MKTKTLFVLIVAIVFFACNNSENKIEKKSDESISLQMKNDSLKKANKQKLLEDEMLKLDEQGIFGRWDCNFSGYESLISFKEENNQYSSIVEFKNTQRTTNEILNKKGDKYHILGSKSNEYYFINSDGNLEFWDKVGLLFTATNIYPGQNSAPLAEFSISNSIGKDLHTITGNYSKSAPETLEGTNNKYWIVYYSDINTTFKVAKSNDIIRKAMNGKVNNMN